MSQTLHSGIDCICTCRRPGERSNERDGLVRSLRHVAHEVYGWIERRRQRQALQDLDDRCLKDIGISRAAAMNEAAKPFWR
jgi:uncharacterized protein YjiS (DUF1127 family)